MPRITTHIRVVRTNQDGATIQEYPTLAFAYRTLLGTPTDEEIAKISPTRRVPVLVHDGLVVWESLAICEYVSELAGGRGWPVEPRLRALARAAAAEMHSGFGTLRSACPMNVPK